MCASTLWPLLSSTRNIAFGSASTTWPSISMTPSFLAMSSANCSAVLTPAQPLPAHTDLHDSTATEAVVRGESSHRADSVRPTAHLTVLSRTGETGRSAHTVRLVSHHRVVLSHVVGANSAVLDHTVRSVHFTQQAQFPGAPECILTIVHTQFSIDGSQLGFHGVHRNEQPLRCQ